MITLEELQEQLADAQHDHKVANEDVIAHCEWLKSKGRMPGRKQSRWEKRLEEAGDKVREIRSRISDTIRGPECRRL